ncbi:HAD-IA family hydrolase [Paludibaculum fermentans]|nr:HAD-IA family hydrolase [Paludibaculum fermentans]
MKDSLLVFDMDGVLAEVGDSYRETIVQTVAHFTGQQVARERIQDYKNQGGWNNDWALSQRLCQDLGVDVPYEEVIERFNLIFLGDDFNGLILKEQWVPRNGLLERLSERYDLSIFTGRPLKDAAHTLRRFASGIVFSPMITMESVTEHKPAPQGLHLIRAERPDAKMFYVGDTVDDARSARAAGVPFIGIAAPANPRHAELVDVLKSEAAIAVLDDINQLEGVLP